MAQIDRLAPAALDRSLLHVFVFGEAIGEAIAVALPERGWILVDGCRVLVGGDEHFPAMELYKDLRSDEDEPIELLVWTHPHADHYLGIRECVDTYAPRRIGMTLVETPAPGSPAAELAAMGSHPLLPADLRLQDVFKQVRSTLERIFSYWDKNPSARYPLSAEVPPLVVGATRVEILAPPIDALRQFYALPRASLESALRNRANEYSVVLMLEFGATKVLLGGDLPYSGKSGGIIPHGWRRVTEEFPACVDHDVFKISHHGSARALSPSFNRRPSPPRDWFVTPFVKEHLPRPSNGPDGGLRQILRRVDAVRLTSSSGLCIPAEPGDTVLRSHLAKELAAVEATGFSGGLRLPGAADVYDFGWGVAVDSERNIRKWFAGAQAVTIQEG